MIACRPALHLFLFFLALYALTSSGNAFRAPDEFEVPYGTTLYSEAWLAAAFVWAAWAWLDARGRRSIDSGLAGLGGRVAVVGAVGD